VTLTDQQIETLAFDWPWEYGQVERALRLAEEQGWDLDDTVRGLDEIAKGWGDTADPEQVIRAAVAYQRQRLLILARKPSPPTP
jgi:hypothetical protein